MTVRVNKYSSVHYRGMANGVQPTTPRAPITPRVPITPRGGRGDGFTTSRSQKRAPAGPVESSTEDEMVFEKHVRSGSGNKRSRRNGLQVRYKFSIILRYFATAF